MISSGCEPPDEELDEGDGSHGGAGLDQFFDILGGSAVAAEPSEGAFDDPALGQQMESLGVALAPDGLEAEPLLRGSTGCLVALIAGVGVGQGQPREAAANAAADLGQAVPILNVGGMNTRTSGRPSVSVNRWRLRLSTFLPASKPRIPWS